LLLEGQAISKLLDHYPKDFFELTKKASSVICCRCLPSQKALLARLFKENNPENKRLLCIGDGGNDVGMI
jgi:phospholipid-translocating ATPase